MCVELTISKRKLRPVIRKGNYVLVISFSQEFPVGNSCHWFYRASMPEVVMAAFKLLTLQCNIPTASILFASIINADMGMFTWEPEKEITSCNFLFPRISCRKFLPLILSGVHARR